MAADSDLQCASFNPQTMTSLLRISPFEYALQSGIAVVGVEGSEEGRVDGIGVPDESEHGQSHLRQHGARDVSANPQQVLNADAHAVPI